ncbi:MAG TPA: hypothetical protein VN175_06905 [Rhizomicrobium sp.]|nr:hypothetical protein [Rhizomicrobium sp.]
MSTRFVFVTLVFTVLLSSCSSPSDDRPDQCHPCTVSMQVGPLLKDAQQMIAVKNYEGAIAKVNEADAVKSNPDDTKVINAMRRYIQYASSPPPPSPVSDAKAKFASDYNAGRFKDVIADEDMLKKAGALDAQAQLVITQAYFKAGDYAGCVKYAKPLNSDVARELEARCAYEIGHRPQP